MVDEPGHLGGVEAVVAVLARGLAARGHIVDRYGLYPATPRPGEPEPAPPGFYLHQADPGLLYSPLTPWHRAKLAVRGQWRGVRAFDRGVRALRERLARHPDTVMVATQLRSAEYLAAGGFDPARLIVQYHDAHHAAHSGQDMARLRWIASRSARILALSEGDAALFRESGITGATTMRNPFDLSLLERFDPRAPREDTVVMGARYEAQKALDVAVRAWADVGRDHPGWELRIFGEGTLRGELQALIDATGARARLMGSTADLPAQLATASIHALSSAHEGMPVVIAEAMCVGTPTVTTDSSPGVRELVGDDEAGLVVPTGDVPALAAALRRLIDDPALRVRLAERGPDRIRRFDPEAVLDDWEALFDELRMPAALSW